MQLFLVTGRDEKPNFLRNYVIMQKFSLDARKKYWHNDDRRLKTEFSRKWYVEIQNMHQHRHIKMESVEELLT